MENNWSFLKKFFQYNFQLAHFKSNIYTYYHIYCIDFIGQYRYKFYWCEIATFPD